MFTKEDIKEGMTLIYNGAVYSVGPKQHLTHISGLAGRSEFMMGITDRHMSAMTVLSRHGTVLHPTPAKAEPKFYEVDTQLTALMIRDYLNAAGLEETLEIRGPVETAKTQKKKSLDDILEEILNSNEVPDPREMLEHCKAGREIVRDEDAKELENVIDITELLVKIGEAFQ